MVDLIAQPDLLTPVAFAKGFLNAAAALTNQALSLTVGEKLFKKA